MPRIAIYPGSFDPFTHGHLDIVARASRLFDRVIVAVTTQGLKDPLFPIEERLALIRRAVRRIPRVSAESFSGLLVDYARRKGACAILRGLRAVSDFEYEFQMALMNRRLSQERRAAIEMVYLMPDEKYTYLSSTLVKEVSRLGGSIRSFVTPDVERALRRRQRA